MRHVYKDVVMEIKLKLSVIISTKNRAKDAKDCICFLLEQTTIPDEIIVVDASSTDLLDKEIRALLVNHNDIRYVYLKQRGRFGGLSEGLAAARNEGIKHASGDIVLFLDDDVTLDARYIESILDIYENDTEGEIGGVTGVPEEKGRVGVISGLKKLFCFIFVIDSPNHGKVLRSGFNTGFEGIQSITDVDWLSGCNMSYRRQIFDEFSFEGSVAEDLDLSHRVSKRYKLKATPLAKLEHEFSELGRADLKKYCFWNTYGRYLFFDKNMGRNFLNWVSFVWAMLGLLIGNTIFLLIRPGKDRLNSLVGTVKGEVKIVKQALASLKRIF
jgi:glycosyltransferase involved in cell wall biosynthesis